MPVTSPAAKPAESSAPQRSNRTVPKVRTSQPASMSSDSAAPRTPIKAPGDASKASSFQFGSISPGFMNGMQVPDQTSTAPPNLDEQKGDQARHDSFNLPNLEQSRDLHTIISSSAPSKTIPVAVKPSAGSIGEKVADSMRPNSSHGAEKGESPKHVRPSGEASSSYPERDSEICSESSLQQSKHDAESLAASKSLPVATNQSAVSAVISSEGLIVDNVVIGRLDNHDKDEVVTAKKYSRDFLLKYTEQYLVLPKGFEITSETDRALMSVYINISHQNKPSLDLSKAKNSAKGGKKKMKEILQKADATGTTSDLHNAYKGPDEKKETKGGKKKKKEAKGGKKKKKEILQKADAAGQQVIGRLDNVVIGRLDNHDKDEEAVTAKNYSRDFLLKDPRQVNEEQAKQRQIRDILNKLTPTNFEKLIEQVKAINIDNAATLISFVSQIFDRALMGPIYCETYVNFCSHLAGELPDFNEDNEKLTFKRVLLNKCQEEFERGEREQEEEANKADEEDQIKQSAEEREEKRDKARRRMLGNIRIIGELYKKKMLTERIMDACLHKLLGQYQDPDEEVVEALCKLMSTIGEMIDHQKAKEHMDAYFDRMKALSNNMNLSSRVRFMLKDAIDLRKNKWQQMRKVEGPNFISEVHTDASTTPGPQGRLGRGPPAMSSAPVADIPSETLH